jgi:cytochrome P450
MAGYETTTNGLAWAFERLLRSPEVLEPLLSDLRQGEDGYLDAIVKETLRSRPVVPVVARRLRAPAMIADYPVPAGTILMVSIYLAHHDPATYPEPDEFRPDRFIGGVPDGAAWIPFGGGVRRCLGANFAQLEMKMVLREVFASARLQAVGSRPEGTKRKRFTFAPAKGAEAVVEGLIPATRPLGERRRFPAEAPSGAVNV